jgi:hypothetical protein
MPCYDDFCNEKEIRSVADAMYSNGLRVCRLLSLPHQLSLLCAAR